MIYSVCMHLHAFPMLFNSCRGPFGLVSIGALIVLGLTCGNFFAMDFQVVNLIHMLALKDANTKAEATSSAKMANYMPAGMKLPF